MQMMRVFASLVLLYACGLCFSDDGWVGNGGTPSLMKGHSSIRMVREVVNMALGRQETVVDAFFWFRNEGRSTTVQMGFPDEGSDPDGKPTLKNFSSWVDGREVQTRFFTTQKDGKWHVKTVTIPRGRTVIVRNRYRVKTGVGRIGPKEQFASYGYYTLHTGASWKGPIGEVIVNVRFALDVARPTAVFAAQPVEKALESGTAKAADRAIRHYSRAVLWRGFAKPRVRPGILTFYGRNLNPTSDDDISLTFLLRRDPKLEKKITG